MQNLVKIEFPVLTVTDLLTAYHHLTVRLEQMEADLEAAIAVKEGSSHAQYYLEGKVKELKLVITKFEVAVNAVGALTLPQLKDQVNRD